MKKLDITKPITTRDGRPVTNVCVDKDGVIWGMVDGNMDCRGSDGMRPHGNPLGIRSSADWISPPETHEITVYVYRTPLGSVYASKYQDSYLDTLIAKFTKTIKEGEGLDGIVDK